MRHTTPRRETTPQDVAGQVRSTWDGGPAAKSPLPSGSPGVMSAAVRRPISEGAASPVRGESEAQGLNGLPGQRLQPAVGRRSKSALENYANFPKPRASFSRVVPNLLQDFQQQVTMF